MKETKKLFIFILSLFVIVSTIAINSNVKAASLEVNEETIINKYGVTYSHLNASFDGGKEKNVNYFNMKTDGQNSKLVTWAKTSSSGVSLATLSSIAEDYEKKHPGWMVVAGINADQWYYGTTSSSQQGGYFFFKNQSYYPFAMDGQNMFTINPLGGSSNGIAIMNNSLNPIIGVNGSVGIELQIYDENDNVIATYPVHGYNRTPNSGETIVWSAHTDAGTTSIKKRTVDSANDLYIISSAELSYMNNSREYASVSDLQYAAVDSFYGRGKVSSVANSVELGGSQFAIETTNEEIKSKLTTGVKVVVEQQFAPSEANKAESVTGFHTQHISNGIVQDSNAPYNTKSYPRSIFGTKEDGSYFLMTTRDVQSTSKGGTTYSETNSLLQRFGAYNAFQDDGGGSVTAIYRNNSGTFDVVHESTDGNKQRSVFSGLFFVVRDPGFISNQINSTASTVTLTKKTTTFAKEITDIRAVVGNKEIEITEDKAVIEGLEDNKEHAIEIRYKYKGEECSAIVYAKTKAYSPGLDINANHDGFTITKRTTDEVLKTVDATFMVDGVPYKMGNVEEFKIEGLFKDTTYSISYTYTVLNTKTNETFERTKEASTYKTLSYEIPSVEKFELASSSEASGRVAFSYKYSDPDNLVTKAYILINNEEEQQLTSKSGYASITNLELGKIDYEFKIVLEYEVLDRLSYAYSEIINIAKKEHIHTWDEATCEAPKTCTDCGETEGTSLGHEWTDATCENPKTCTRCNKTEGSKLQHSWTDATSDAPKTCTKCGETEGEPLPKKKGCKKSSLASIILSIGLVTSALYLIRRKK